MQDQVWDNIVIGSGVSGLVLALRLAETEKVLILTKGPLYSGASTWAQGGIASVVHAADSFAKHVDDTVAAGAGLCHVDIVRRIVEKGPKSIHRLREMGVHFTTRGEVESHHDNELHLTQEGGHSHRRVVHSEDFTGAAIMKVLCERVRENPNITVRENFFTLDLITSDKVAPDFSENLCLGAYFFDRDEKKVMSLRAAKTFLCTGGHGRVYLYTSNPETATGDGVAMAWRAGCKIANLEFMQFHPTCLYHPQAKNFLISEALRGEGAELVDRNGLAFMPSYHPRGSLAPRDIVSRAISQELDRSGASHVYLDATRLGERQIMGHFPNIFDRCLALDIDIRKSPIPVIPAAHYSCGGVITDQRGRTGVKGLYAVGEVACTGLHGANRLASNSLLESVVMAEFAALDAKTGDWSTRLYNVNFPEWHSGDALPVDELGILSCNWDEIRRLMWHYVGIIRSEARLQRALDRILRIRDEIDRYYWKYEVSEQLLEVRNLCHVALLTIKCARARKESRGIHYMLDYPEDLPAPAGLVKDTVIW